MGIDKLQLLAQSRQLFENPTLSNSKSILISAKNTVQRGEKNVSNEKKNVKNEKKKVIPVRRCLNRIDLCRQIVAKKRAVRRQRTSASKNIKALHKKRRKKKKGCLKRFNVKRRRNECSEIVTRNSSKPCDKFKFSPCIGHRERNQPRTLTKKVYKNERHVKKRKSIRIRESWNRIAACRNKVTTKLARCRNNSRVPNSKNILVSEMRKSLKKIENGSTQSKSCLSSIRRKRRARRSFKCRKRIKRKRALYRTSALRKVISTKPRRMKCVRKSKSWSSFNPFCIPVVTREMSRNFQTWQENMSTNNNILQNIFFAKSYVRAWNLTRGQATPGIIKPQMRTVSTPYQAPSIFQHSTSPPSVEDHRPLLTQTSLPALLSTQYSVSFQRTPSTALQSVSSTSRVSANANNLWNSYAQSYFQPTYNQNQQTFDGIAKTPTDYRMLRMFGKSCNKTNLPAVFNVSKESSMLAIKTRTLTHEPSFQRNATSLYLKQSTMPSCFVTNFDTGNISTNGDRCDNLKTDLKGESKIINRNCIPERDGYTVPVMSSYFKDSSSKEDRGKGKQQNRDINYDIKTLNALEINDQNSIELSSPKSCKFTNIIKKLETTSKNEIYNFNIKSEISNNARLCIQNTSEDSTKNMNAFTCKMGVGSKIENSNGEVSGCDDSNIKKVSSDCSNSRDAGTLEVAYYSDQMFSATKNILKYKYSPRIKINEENKEINSDSKYINRKSPFPFAQHAWRDVNTNTHSPFICFSKGKREEESSNQNEMNKTKVSVQNQKKLMHIKRNCDLKMISKEDPFLNFVHLPKSIRSNRKLSNQVKNDSERMDSAKAVDLNSFEEQVKEKKHWTDTKTFDHEITKTEYDMCNDATSLQTALNQDYSHEDSTTQFSSTVPRISPYDLQGIGEKIKDIEEHSCTTQKSCLCRKKTGQIFTNNGNEVSTYPVHTSTQNASVQVDIIDRNSAQMQTSNVQHIQGEAIESNDINYQTDPFLRFSLGSNFMFSNPVYNDISSSSISSESEIRSSSNSTEDSSCHDSSENSSLESISSTGTFQSVSESSEICSSSENSNLDEISLQSQESVSTQDSYISDETPTIYRGTGNTVMRSRLASSSDSTYMPSSRSSEEGDSPFLETFQEEGALRHFAKEAKQLEAEVWEQLDERHICVNASSGMNFSQFGSDSLHWLKQNRGNLKSIFGVNDSSTRTVLCDSINVSEDDHFKPKEVPEAHLERRPKPNPFPTSPTGKERTGGIERPNDQEHCEGQPVPSIPDSPPANLIAGNCAHSPKRHASEHAYESTWDHQLGQLSTNRILAHIGLNIHASEMPIESTVSPYSKLSSNAYHRIMSLCGYRSCYDRMDFSLNKK